MPSLIRPLFAIATAILLLMGGLAALSPLPAQEKEATEKSQDDTEPTENDVPEENADEEESGELPLIDDLKPPTYQELMTGKPFDWVVLKSKEVVICEPVFPRPDTLTKMEQAISAKAGERKGLKGEQLAKVQQELEDLNHLIVTPLQKLGDDPEYRIHIRDIKEIITYEEHRLRGIDQLIAENDWRKAYELLLTLARDEPEWPGIKERSERLVFVEATVRIQEKRPETALVLLEDLHKRNPEYPELSETTGTAVDELVQSAREAKDTRRTRHFLTRLKNLYEQHPVLQRWSDELAREATVFLEESDSHRAAGELGLAVRSVEKSVNIWPSTPKVEAAYRQLSNRYQIIRVGVLRQADEPAPYPFPADAEQRREVLCSRPLFEADRNENGIIRYRSRYLESWEPFDLGRKVVFRLRSTRQPWESLPPLTADALAHSVSERINPVSPLYDERLAGCVASVQVDSPALLTIQLKQVPFRLESLFTWPVDVGNRTLTETAETGKNQRPAGRRQVAAETDVSQQPSATSLHLANGFRQTSADENRMIFQRTFPEPDKLTSYHVAEVEELKFSTPENALQALLRDQLNLLLDMPPKWVHRLKQEERIAQQYFFVKFAIPVTHSLHFNPRSTTLKVRELRRALAYAIDRNTVLSQAVLEGAPATEARIVSSVFGSNSYANNILVQPWRPDIYSAVAMTLAAKKQLKVKDIPPLKMLVSPDLVSRSAAQALVSQWKRAGITVEIAESVPEKPLEPQDWDIVYRTSRLEEPSAQLWPFLTQQTTARVADLSHLPDWLRRELVELDRAGDRVAATEWLRKLHVHLFDEVFIIPLWEVDDTMIIRKNLRGIPDNPLFPYQGIDRWISEPIWNPNAL